MLIAWVMKENFAILSHLYFSITSDVLEAEKKEINEIREATKATMTKKWPI
jgi:hypothetical protein